MVGAARFELTTLCAKYLGKDEKTQAARDPIPGRWWGKVSKQNIPWAEMRELELPVRMRIHCQRIARRIRQKKADAAKYHCLMRELGPEARRIRS